MRIQGIPRTLLVVLAALAPGATACTSRQIDLGQPPTRDVTGHYTGSRGQSWFRPCGLAPSDSAWWVTFTDRAVIQRDSLRRVGALPDGERRFVRWLAAVAEDGRVGPRGPGATALLVREIIDVRQPTDRDCEP